MAIELITSGVCEKAYKGDLIWMFFLALAVLVFTFWQMEFYKVKRLKAQLNELRYINRHKTHPRRSDKAWDDFKR